MNRLIPTSASIDMKRMTPRTNVLCCIGLALLSCSACQSLPDVSKQNHPAPLVGVPAPLVGVPAPRAALPAEFTIASPTPRRWGVENVAPVVTGDAWRLHESAVAKRHAPSSAIQLVSYDAADGLPPSSSTPVGEAYFPHPAALPPSAYYTPGTALPAPEAALEYICNGGDAPPPVLVKNDWSVHGLNSGDAVAHYDTSDGRLEVTPSNEVCIYAPRFASVRRVSSVIIHQQNQSGMGVTLPLAAVESNETQIATTTVQPLQPGRHVAINTPQRLREETRGVGVDNRQRLMDARGTLLPYEDFLLIQRGQFDNSEKARLATRLAAAITWTHDLGVQVTIDNEVAVEAANEVGLQSVYLYELPEGKPRLRVVKVASTDAAQVGDIVDFTIRFDNVGDQPVGNVTIVDHLVTRLEYVSDSQQSSVTADFSTQDNVSESLTLRWEIAEPLQVGDGGILRFQARVR